MGNFRFFEVGVTKGPPRTGGGGGGGGGSGGNVTWIFLILRRHEQWPVGAPGDIFAVNIGDDIILATYFEGLYKFISQ